MIAFAYCQEESYVLNIIGNWSDVGFAKFSKERDEKFVLKKIAIDRLRNKISNFRQDGYLEANIDSIYSSNDTIHAFVHLGEMYKWTTVEFIESRQILKHTSHLKKKARFSDLQELNTDILSDLGNQGYPFAQIEIEKFAINKKDISGVWRIDANDKIIWDSLVIKGTSKVKAKFLQRYLGIFPNQIYQEKQSSSISDKLNNLNFAKEIKPSEIEFSEGKAQVYTYLEKKSANQFDGIVGFQSNKKNNKLELTGEVKLLLENTFQAGERIHFNWQKLKEQSQNLSLGLVYPYLFSSNIGVDLNFDIQKLDSTYITTALDAGLRFSQTGKNFIKIFFELNSSSLLSSEHLKSITVLPNYADVKSQLFGFSYHFENLDYSFNPRKGWNVNFSIAGGSHQLEKNSNIPEELYENIDLSSKMMNAEWMLEYNIPLNKKLSFRIRNKGGFKNSKELFQNDLFRIGGLSSIRGFNEEAFIASSYSVVTSELRFIPQANSSFYLFWDGGYYRNSYLPEKNEDYPWGIGFGLNFATKSGIFTLNYAIGKQNNSSIDLQAAKIHFGFINRF